jgi:hypothetical protein
LVAFSCKASVCPSCATRRMENRADHLVRNVMPAVRCGNGCSPSRAGYASSQRATRPSPRGSSTSSPAPSSRGSEGAPGGWERPIRGPGA